MFEINLSNKRYMQYIAAFTASSTMAAIATFTSWASPTIPKFKLEDSPIGPVSDAEISWIISSYSLGAAASSLLAIPIVKTFGPKRILLTCCLFLIFPWIAITLAKSIVALCVSRFMGGMVVGPMASAVAIYSSEIGEKDIRGRLCLSYTIMRLIGGSFVLSVGPFVSYTTLGIICAVIPLICFVLFCNMPESPYYLIKTNQKTKARMNIVRLSNNNVDDIFIDKRMVEIEKILNEDMKNKSTMMDMLTNRLYRKSFIIMFALKSMQRFIGVVTIESYMQTIIELSDSSVSPEISSIICGVIQFPAAFITAAVVDNLGRKPLIIISATGCAAALLAEGAYFYIRDGIKGDVSSITWLPTTAIVVFLVMDPLGVGSVPNVVMGEIFSTNIKEPAISIILCYSAFLNFLVVKFFDPISKEFGIYTSFWIYAVSGGLCALSVLFFLPETKGKSFGAIQNKLTKKKKNGSGDVEAN